MTIRDAVVFDIAGSLTTSNGALANFLRGSKAYAEYIIDGGIHLVEVSTHQPRFDNDGSLYLEPGASNYVRKPTDLGDTSLWIRGSHVNVLNNTSTSMANTYEADRVTITPGTGNVNRQTMRQELTVPSGTTTFTFYLRLIGGVFGPQDKMKIVGDVEGGSVEVSLSEVYNEAQRRYLPVTITTNVSGTGFGNVSLQLYIESTVSFDFGGASASSTGYRTTFVDGLTASPARANEYLAYEKSPIDGLHTFTIYFGLADWRGNGTLFTMGNLTASLSGDQLTVNAGGALLTSIGALPKQCRVAVRINRDDNSAKLFVNGTLHNQTTVSNFVGARANFDLSPTGVRRYRSLYVFDRAFTDGSPTVGNSAGNEMAELFADDAILLRQTDGRGIISFPSVRIKPRARAAVRLPQTQYAAGTITQTETAETNVAQVILVDVLNIPNGDQTQNEWISINGNPPLEVHTKMPTRHKILAELEAVIMAEPRLVPVRATLSEVGLILTADSPGNSFTVAVSANLSTSLLQANQPALNSLWLQSPSDFRLGTARIVRNNLDVTDIIIHSINEVTGEIKFSSQPVRLAKAVQVGDVVFQSDWRTNIAPGNYVVGIHESHLNEVAVSDKAIDGFALENNSTRELVVTPFIRVTV